MSFLSYDDGCRVWGELLVELIGAYIERNTDVVLSRVIVHKVFDGLPSPFVSNVCVVSSLMFADPWDLNYVKHPFHRLVEQCWLGSLAEVILYSSWDISLCIFGDCRSEVVLTFVYVSHSKWLF